MEIDRRDEMGPLKHRKWDLRDCARILSCPGRYRIVEIYDQHFLHKDNQHLHKRILEEG